MVGDDVEEDPEPGVVGGGAEAAELAFAAEVGGDAGRVGHVVAVQRTVPRLERRREVEVRRPELGDVRHGDLARVAEPEGGRQLEAVRAAPVRHGRCGYRSESDT